ncbi:MAG: hypothetical protein JSS11_07600, partial [Verrucomicrobia bacterium]|nr:hypothetical protein [Verrucomicrobiota bacterium]
MVAPAHNRLLAALERWCEAERAVQSAVLFGSQARAQGQAAAADGWSDIDLHIITSAADRIEREDWRRHLPDFEFCLQVARPATGGVRKLTVLLAEGEVDLVLVPAGKFKLAECAMKLGLHRKLPAVRDPLNRLATIMGGGYRFIKGERRWGPFYARIVAELEGYRLDEAAVHRLANVFLCELLWVLQKIERGELVAAQRTLHSTLVETNVLLLHEARVRNGLPTFQQARRVEKLVTPAELAMITVSARCDAVELRRAAWQVFEGLRTLMTKLVPGWTVPPTMIK